MCMAAAPNAQLAETDSVNPLVPRPYTIQRRRKETPDTFTLELTRENGATFSFAPGQFNMLYALGAVKCPFQ